MELPPGGRALVRTGVAIALPAGYVGLVHPRSGLADRLGVTVLNAPGTVDAGYRGEILVNLINHDPARSAKISRGDRIAQLVVQRVERAEFDCVDELPDCSRGTGGHGSTGGHAILAGDAALDGRRHPCGDATRASDAATRDADRVAVGDQQRRSSSDLLA